MCVESMESVYSSISGKQQVCGLCAGSFLTNRILYITNENCKNGCPSWGSCSQLFLLIDSQNLAILPKMANLRVKKDLVYSEMVLWGLIDG